tara:strand:- start:283 stop:600 length:318 start_codon:yes stop_codon:yes gene_type:complete
MSDEFTVGPQISLSDWGIIKRNIQSGMLNVSEYMSLTKTFHFKRFHVEQMQKDVEDAMQALDILHRCLIDMDIELNKLENMQLQIDLGDANKNEIAWFEKREAQD